MELSHKKKKKKEFNLELPEMSSALLPTIFNGKKLKPVQKVVSPQTVFTLYPLTL